MLVKINFNNNPNLLKNELFQKDSVINKNGGSIFLHRKVKI